ncbi:amidase [Devosia sp. Leaf420]|uniref:amidase n=1 Tax=Devosia sp. Leaf420 TaxID=1736374 RepID=UPI000AF83FD1|nr:amidase [Devosia sp. Leaf420]
MCSDDRSDRAAYFRDRAKAAGLRLSEGEAESLFGLAAWMSDGLAGPTRAAPDDAVLDLDIAELGARLRDGRLTSVALIEATLQRIAERGPSYLAFYAVAGEQARLDAQKADAELAEGQDRGPLHGIPVGIKDMIDVAGLATTANAPGRREAVATADAEVVRRLSEAGAVIIGKLATYEWGTVGPDKRGLFPPAKNPWSLEHITGGSSSGCAVAVAGGLLRTTIGTDTGGSVRGPAFYCGVVGFKPTFGSVPEDGVLTMSPSMDHVGPMSRTVAEAALTFDVIAAKSGDEAAARLIGQSVSGLSIGYARNWFADDPQVMPAVVAAMDAALSKLSELGASIGEIDLPDYPSVEIAAAAILHKESFDFHAGELREHPDAYGRRAFLSLAGGFAIDDRELAAARQIGREFTLGVNRLLDAYDVIITVGALTTALEAAPFEKEAVWTPMRTIGFNVSGHPVLAMPIGFHEGLPIGMQIIGRHHDEARIIQVGHAFEQATDFSLQRPPIPI